MKMSSRAEVLEQLFNAITGNQLKTFEIPLSPLPEQHRIVAKIEELFTKLDAGINELHKAQSQLKRYRQSVLKAAFEGKLTEAWRTEASGKGLNLPHRLQMICPMGGLR